ncbi:putative CDP-alcohol phosphatidyltransferase class-I family protein C22A12.08c [Dichanthelium oligosanthes]|uniref:Putative CDP-alcohol phosphatidyltransferase class-I family protein C22A12.08c n=1 Tax=Dichanthelium oligosanthes TaxID=888268 RepID=A0A1E5VA98_9POAL|nr:putative CDP-alcohol phosphatidyltransferase class-I family protein C22A12.08c [Dichanthelium oligosanthes]
MRGFRFALVRAERSRSRAELQTAQRRGPSDLAQRFSHSAAAPARPPFGIAFDIDGVILRGRSPIGGAPRAIRRLYSEDGGGVPEHTRALELSQLLGVNISPTQVVHGHSPYRELVNRFEDDLIVAVGKGEPAVVMSEYGFRKVLSIDEYASYFKDIDPLAPFKTWKVGQTDSYMSAKVHPSYDVYSERVKGVFVVSDPVDWGRDLQAAFPSERLGMGAFRIALESIFNQINDHPLKYTTYGKPNPLVFKNAANILEKLVMSMYPNSQTLMELNDCQFSTIYMVGDNPKVDINGASKAGHPWSSVLTRTGVFRGKVNDPHFPADAVVDTVEDAINYILEKECIR